MRRVEMEGAVRRVRDIRLALAALLALSMTANLALTVGLAGRETVTVLVPAVTGPAWAVGGSSMRGPGRGAVSRGHGAHRGGDAADADARERGPCAPCGGAPGARLGARRDRRLGRGRGRRAWPGATWRAPSIPLEIEADPGAALAVEIAGELVTWIGREEASREDRRYRLVFRIDAGRIGLLRFEQLESGK